MARRKRARPSPPRPATGNDPRRAPRIPAAAAALAIVAGLLLLYAGHYRDPLLFDDRIINPPQLQEFLRWWMSMQPRWLSYGTFGLNYLLSGMDLAPYRLVNVLLHCAVVLACYAFLRDLLAAERAHGEAPGRAQLAALCASAVYAVHPVTAYAVGYLAQRSIVLATLFSILSLHAFLVGLRRHEDRWLWLSVLCYFLAIWSKEHAVMLPAAIVAMTLCLHAPGAVLARRLALPLLGFAAVGLLIVLRMKGLLGETYEKFAGEVLEPAQSATGATSRPAGGLAADGAAVASTPADSAYALSAITQAGLFFRYLLLWLLPVPAWMSADIRVPMARSTAEWQYLAGVAAYLAWGATGFALAMRRGRHALAGFAMLLPFLLYATEFVATRVQEPFVLYRSYLWMIGLPVALAVLLRRLPAARLATGTLILCIALTAATRERLDSLSSPLRFWDDVVRKNSDRSLRFVDRGLANRAVALMHEGRHAEALADLDEALRLNPRNAHAWINRANIRAKRGEAATALADAAEALRLDPDFGEAYAERCAIFMKLERHAEAFDDCDRALKLSPSYPLALLNRGVLYANRGQLESAIADFAHVLKFDARNPVALYNHGMSLRQAGRAQEARASLAEACRLGVSPACEALRNL